MPSSLASLVVKLEVESANVRSGLDAVNRKLDEFDRRTKEASKSFESSFRKINETAEGLKNTIGASLPFSLARDAVAGLWSVVKDGAVALAEEERSVGKLEAALGQLGGNTQALLVHFEAQTEELERLTLVDDQAIRSVQQLQIQMGIAPRAIETTTRAILDYAAATGQDAVSAGRSLLNAIQGGKDEISKMGISIELTEDKTTNLERAAAALEERFGGSAQAATSGLSGELGRLGKAAEDASKSLAAMLQRSGVMTKVLDTLAQALDGVSYALGEEHEQTQATVERTKALDAAREAQSRMIKRLADLEASRAREAASQRGFYDEEIEKEKARVKVFDEKIAKIKAEQAAASAASNADAQRRRDGEKAAATTAPLKTAGDDLKRQKDALADLARAEKKMADERERAAKKLQEHMERIAEAGQKAAGALDVSFAEIDRKVAGMRLSFTLVGATQGPDTRGFASLEEALDALATALKQQQQQEEMAKLLEMDGDLDGARQAQLAADAARALAEKAEAAASAFSAIKEAIAASTPPLIRALDQFHGGLSDAYAALDQQTRFLAESAVGAVEGALGRVGGLIQSAGKGAAAAGPVGAAAAVGLDLLGQSEQMGRITTMLDGFVQGVADTLGRVLEPVMPLLASIMDAFDPILRAVGPALERVLSPLGHLAPAFEALAVTFDAVAVALAPIFEAILGPLDLFEVAGRALFEAVKFLGQGILFVAKGIGEVWNGILSAVSGVLDALASIELAGIRPFAILDGLVDNMMVDTEGLGSALDALGAMTWEQAKAAAEASAQTRSLGAAAGAGAGVLNGPAGYKVELQRFNAMIREALPSRTAAPGTSPSGTNGGGNAAPTPAPVVNVSVELDGQELAREIRVELKKDTGRRRGTTSDQGSDW